MSASKSKATRVAAPFGELKLAIATPRSQNKKLGDAATTYAAQTSCPTSCPFFDGGGCYAESGRVGMVTKRLNEAARILKSGPLEVADAEAAAIDALKVTPGRALRLHTVGDCSTDAATALVAAASARYRQRGGGPVWTYTHAWRTVSRASWGEVSVLASCESAAEVKAAKLRGYATAIVVDELAEERRHVLGADAGNAAGVDVLPCPQQTRDRTCSDCKLCFDDQGLIERDYSIAFLVHGAPATVRAAKKALRARNDPNRRLSTRVLIPRVIAEMEAEGAAVTNAAIARRLDCSPSSVADMRRRMEVADKAADGAKKARIGTHIAGGKSMKSKRRPRVGP
jgi:hypothetical protein